MIFAGWGANSQVMSAGNDDRHWQVDMRAYEQAVLSYWRIRVGCSRPLSRISSDASGGVTGQHGGGPAAQSTDPAAALTPGPAGWVIGGDVACTSSSRQVRSFHRLGRPEHGTIPAGGGIGAARGLREIQWL